MFALTDKDKFHLYRNITDMRKSFNGLLGVVNSQDNLSIYSGEVFAFVNQNKNKMKLVQWQPGGFVLYYKKLEKGTFDLPEFKGDFLQLSWQKLYFIIEGISLDKYKQKKRLLSTEQCS
jgi:transposase